MAEIGVLRVEWRGLPGGTGLSQFAFNYGTDSGAAAASSAVSSAFNYWATLVPNDITIQPLQEVLVFDEVTGVLTDVRNVTPWAAKTGAWGTNDFAWGTGCWVNWGTGLVTGGRRLAGRTFIVPIGAGNFNNGILTSAAVTTMTNGAQAIVTANQSNSDGSIMVWGRPRKASATAAARGGVAAPITSFKTPTKIGGLRGRRQ